MGSWVRALGWSIDPGTARRCFVLDLVASDRTATIVSWWLPVELHRRCCDVSDRWRKRSGWGGHTIICLPYKDWIFTGSLPDTSKVPLI